MRLFRDFSKKPEKHGLTLGNFDGVHRGHHLLFNSLRERVGEQGTIGALTFSNHPSTVLRHLPPSPLLCSKSHKIRLLQEAGVDTCFSLVFTEALAALSYRDFLAQIREVFPFDFLILGKGAAFGKKQEGTQARILELASEWGFEAIYLDKIKDISSGETRKAILSGALDTAAHMLGRPFSILGELKEQTLLFEEPLCLPPKGSYPVVLRAEEGSYRAKAHIDKTVTVEDLPRPLHGTVELLFDPLHF